MTNSREGLRFIKQIDEKIYISRSENKKTKEKAVVEAGKKGGRGEKGEKHVKIMLFLYTYLRARQNRKNLHSRIEST